jgi:hypothetical protein
MNNFYTSEKYLMKEVPMKVKNLILLGVALTGFMWGFAGPGFQQNGQNQADRIEALRIAFISQQLNLTPAEAQKFWPIYNAYKSDLDALRKNYSTANGPLSADKQLEFEQKKLDLKKTYKPQFEAALGEKKLNELYNLERKFQEKLKEIRDQRMQQRQQGGRPWGGH